METEIEKSQLDDNRNMPRFKLGEMGYNGLNIFDGVTHDELKRELNFPQNIRVYKEMSYHSTINASLSLFTNIVSKATWKFEPPVDATEEEKRQCKIIEEMMGDMEHSWNDFIKDIMSMNQYGFSINEKVYRRRLRSNGSVFNDGLIGWKKLPIRAQESIIRFTYDDSGNNITGVVQNVMGAYPTGNISLKGPEVYIPRDKILHFRAGNHRGDPYGASMLRDAYLAWRYITYLEELEATGVAKDLVGLPILYLPPQYLAPDAPPEIVAIRQYYENVMRNIQTNQQSAMILPLAYDADSKQPLFKMDLLSVDGKKSYDIDKIKQYYKNMIMIAMSSDILTMGQTETGSFALGSIKNSISGAVAYGMLASITDVLDRDLIRQTYELNGWDPSRRGKLDYDNLAEADLESISKYWQRMASVGLVERDREVLDAIRVAGGVDALGASIPVQTDLLTGNTSKSGEGMKTAGEGTAKTVSGNDASSNNLDNAA